MKERKPPEERKKRRKLTKWQMILPALLVGAGTGIALGINYVIAGPPPIRQCITADSMPWDIQVYLAATLDGQPFTVPANIGIEPGCMRPVHTHSDDGTIHIVFAKPIKISLGDFARLWELDGTKYDYKIFVKKEGEADFTEYTSNINVLILEDKMSVRFELTSK